MTEPRSSTYRAVAREGAESLYHADARRALDDGYVPNAETWSEALGQQVLTVQYVYAPEQTKDVRRALADVAMRPAASPAEAAPQPVPYGQIPVDRHVQMNAYRSSVGWSCLLRAMVVIGAALGFIGGLYVGAYPLRDSGLLALLAMPIGLFIGAAMGWWIWTAVWASR